MGNQMSENWDGLTWDNAKDYVSAKLHDEVSSATLQTFSSLISMGFPNDASFEAAKLYPHQRNIYKAIDWISKNEHKFKKNPNMHTGKKQDEKNIISNNEVKELIKRLNEKQEEINTLKYTVNDQEKIITTMEITNKNEEYEQKCTTLQYENHTLKHEKHTYQRKCTDLEKEKQILARRHTQDLQQLQNSIKDDNKQDEKEYRKMEELSSEIRIMKLQNNKLKDQLQQTTMGKGIESGFIKEEDFSTKKISPFRQQIFKNLFDDLFDELEEKYEDLDIDEDSSEYDSKDDMDKVINEEIDTKPRFELLIDRLAYEFLFDLLILSYKFMLKRKSKICQVIAKQLNIENNKQQYAEDIAGVMIHPQLQQQWEYYLKNKMENVYGIIIDEIDKVIDDEIFSEICSDKKYKNWVFLKTKFQKSVKQYIWATCEIGWIMILTKPDLTFYPSSFRMFVNDKQNKYFYKSKDKHDLWTGSKTKYGAKVLFFTMPAIVQKHFMNNQEMQIIKGTLFAHNNEELMEYVMSDPEKLLQM